MFVLNLLILMPLWEQIVPGQKDIKVNIILIEQEIVKQYGKKQQTFNRRS